MLNTESNAFSCCFNLVHFSVYSDNTGQLVPAQRLQLLLNASNCCDHEQCFIDQITGLFLAASIYTAMERKRVVSFFFSSKKVVLNT